VPQIEQFLVITWAKKSVKAKHMIAEGYIPKTAPAPLSKVIAHSPIENKQLVASTESCICKIILACRNIEVVDASIIVNACISCGPLPAAQHIQE
jgi:hypothetical protein